MKIKTLLPLLLCGCFLQPLQAQVVNTGQPLTLSEGALLSIGTDYRHESGSISGAGELIINGSWINQDANSGVFESTSAATVVFNETSTFIGGSSKTVFPNVVLNGSGSKLLAAPVEISGRLELNDAELKVEDQTLTILNTAAGAITRNSGFISTDRKGKLIRKTQGTDLYFFPLGSYSANSHNLLYRPLTIQPETSEPNLFSATFSPYDPSQEGFDRSRKRQDLQHIFDKYFYVLCKETDAIAQIRFQLNTEEDGKFSQLVSWNEYNLWEKAAGTEPNSLTGPALSLSYTTMRRFQNVPFTFADTQTDDPLAFEPLTFFNAFSPDGDGKNDTWNITNIDLYPENILKIFNRWGDEVYQARGYSNSNAWNGGSLNPGTYYYILQVTINGEQKTYKGFITMIKKD